MTGFGPTVQCLSTLLSSLSALFHQIVRAYKILCLVNQYIPPIEGRQHSSVCLSSNPNLSRDAILVPKCILIKFNLELGPGTKSKWKLNINLPPFKSKDQPRGWI